MVRLDLLIVFPDLLMIGPNLLLVVPDLGLVGPRCFCGYSVAKIARFRGGRVRGLAPIILEFRLRVRPRRVLMAYLLRRRRRMLLLRRCKFLSVWLLLYTARAAIKTDIDRGANGDRRIVDVDAAAAGPDIDDSPIVTERAPDPRAAGKSRAAKAETVIHAAIEADMRPPITCVPGVDAVAPAPIARRPKETWRGCGNPGPWDPVVIAIVVIPSPIAWRPQISRAGDGWLHVDRQSGRRYRYGHKKSSMGLPRLSGDDKRREQRDDERDCSHFSIPQLVPVPRAGARARRTCRFHLAVDARSRRDEQREHGYDEGEYAHVPSSIWTPPMPDTWEIFPRQGKVSV